jgi:hypothetical protein
VIGSGGTLLPSVPTSASGGFLSSRVREVIGSMNEYATRQLGMTHLSKILARIAQERSSPRGLSPEYADDERSLVLCFKQLLRILLEAMKDPSVDVRIQVFKVLEECVSNPALTPHFDQYIELLLCRALDGYADPQKEVTTKFQKGSFVIIRKIQSGYTSINFQICNQDSDIYTPVHKTTSSKFDYSTITPRSPIIGQVS